jgi:hypothetical protein
MKIRPCFDRNQAQLLGGLDFIEQYSGHESLNQEDLLHEMLDLDYLTTGLLVGGLASRDKQLIKRSTFLRPEGVLLN